MKLFRRKIIYTIDVEFVFRILIVEKNKLFFVYGIDMRKWESWILRVWHIIALIPLPNIDRYTLNNYQTGEMIEGTIGV